MKQKDTNFKVTIEIKTGETTGYFFIFLLPENSYV